MSFNRKDLQDDDDFNFDDDFKFDDADNKPNAMSSNLTTSLLTSG